MPPEQDPIIDRKAPQRPARAGCLAAVAVGLSLGVLFGALMAWILDWWAGLAAGAAAFVAATLLDALRRRRADDRGA